MKITLDNIIGAIVLTVRFSSNCSALTKCNFVNFVATPALFMRRFKPLFPTTFATSVDISLIFAVFVTSEDFFKFQLCYFIVKINLWNVNKYIITLTDFYLKQLPKLKM